MSRQIYDKDEGSPHLSIDFISDSEEVYQICDKRVTTAGIKDSGYPELLAPDVFYFHLEGQSIVVVE